MSSTLLSFTGELTDTSGATEAAHARWRLPLLTTFALATATVAITSNAWRDIFNIAWNDEESSHVWLVPIIVAWLVSVRRQRLQYIHPKFSLAGPALLLLGWASWTLGYRLQIQICWHGGAVLMLVAAIVSGLGLEFVKAFAPALAVVIFLIPIPATGRLLISVPLQRFTANITQNVAEVLGISMEREGSILTLNGKEVAVAEACNGMRMVFTLFLACYAAAFVSPLRMGVRLLILALSPVLAVVCNVVRLVPTVWVFAHASDRFAETFHDVTGWMMLLLAFGGLLGIARLLNWAGIQVTRDRGYQSTLKSSPRMESQGHPLIFTSLSLVVIAGAATDRLSLPTPRSAAEYHQRIRQAAAEAPMQIGSWAGRDVPPNRESYELLRPNVLISRTYANATTAESVNFMLVQCSDVRDLAPHYPPACYPGRGLTLVRSDERAWSIDGTQLSAMEYEFESNSFLRDNGMIVENFMLLPTGKFGKNPADLRREIGLQNRYFGAAEVQIAFSTDTPSQRRDEIVRTIVKAYKPLFDVIRSGPRN